MPVAGHVRVIDEVYDQIGRGGDRIAVEGRPGDAACRAPPSLAATKVVLIGRVLVMATLAAADRDCARGSNPADTDVDPSSMQTSILMSRQRLLHK